MLSSLRIIHPPCSDNPTNLPVLLLSVESQRYIFNTPEGTTRSLIQRGARGASRGLGHIFLPKVGVEECGGLPGLLMSLADAQRPDVTVHGPPVLTHWLATCRYHLRRDSIKVSVVESPDLSSLASSSKDPDFVIYKDENITIEAVPILPNEFELPAPLMSERNGRPAKRHRSSQQQVSMRARSTSPSTLLRVMFPNDNGPAAKEAAAVEDAQKATVGQTNGVNRFANRPIMSKNAMDPPILAPVPIDVSSSLLHQAPVLMHIVQGSTIRGKLDAKKANSLGVPSGRLLGQLSNGQDIQLERPKQWFQWEEKKKSSWLAKNPLAFKRPVKRPRSASKSNADAVMADSTAKEQEEEEVEVETVLIKSADVMGTPRVGAAFVQIYLPSTQYLGSFLSDSVQARLEAIPEEPHAMIHCVHPLVLLCPAYRQFLAKYKQAHHIIVSRPYLPDRLAFPSSALASLRMNQLDKDLFTVPPYTLIPELSLEELGIDADNVQLAKMDTGISLHPRGPPINYDDLALDIDSPIDSKKVKGIASFETIPGRKKIEPAVIKARQDGWKQYIDKVKSLKEDTQMSNGHAAMSHELKITTLGTGSALPSKYRNVSATLLHMPGKDAGYILLDAGESTYSQLKRKFQGRTDEIIANIRLIFLSHAHADHHMGTTRILLERAKLLISRPLYIVAPYFLRRYLGEVQQVESLGINDSGDLTSDGVIFIDSEYLDSRHGVELDAEAYPELQGANLDDAYKIRLREEARKILARPQNDQPVNEDSEIRVANKLYRDRIGRRQEAKRVRDHMTAVLHGTQVYTTEVDHRTSHCYGIILRGKDWSVAYSGDTRPCANLISAGRGVQLLIHEATIEDSEPEMADMKGHSTFGQAIQVAKEMKANYVMLTHFSQRYPKLPKLNTSMDIGNVKIGIAFDLLTVSLKDFEKMMRYREALEILFDVDGEEEDAGVEESGSKEAPPKVEKKSKRALTDKETNIEAKDGEMEIVSVKGVDAARGDDETAAKSKVNGDESGKRRHFERKYIKSYEYQYICFHLKPMQKVAIEEVGEPSRLSIAQSIQDALVDLNGVVDASFNWDLFDVQMFQDKGIIRVVLKVPSNHLQAMQATISSGLTLRNGSTTFQAQYDRTCSSLDLISMDIGNSQEWFESISKSMLH